MFFRWGGSFENKPLGKLTGSLYGLEKQGVGISVVGDLLLRGISFGSGLLQGSKGGKSEGRV